MTNEELFPLGARALQDIADNFVLLNEIRNRFRDARGSEVMGYQNWRDFVARNSNYSLRTAQRRLNEVNGVRSYTKRQPESNLEREIVEHDAKKEWAEAQKGGVVDEFDQPKKDRAYATITFRFETKKDVDEFAKLIGQKLTNKTKSAWFPHRSHRRNGR
jgi:hypothetical protein